MARPPEVPEEVEDIIRQERGNGTPWKVLEEEHQFGRTALWRALKRAEKRAGNPQAAVKDVSKHRNA